MRLSHLFEVLTFRKMFATAVANVICKAFVYMPVVELPREASTWKKAAKSLQDSFRCKSKLRMQNAREILNFLNGDYSGDCVFHFCVGDCCSGPEESLRKCLQLVVPFLSRGFLVPLLYRFKHFDQAVSYITFAHGIHRLLQRSLANIESKPSSVEGQQLISDLMTGLDLASECDNEAVAATFNDDVCEGEDFAAQNAKRKKLVQQELSNPDFGRSAVIVDHMIKPMDGAMNQLLRHSERITRLAVLSDQDPNWRDTAAKTKAVFLSVMSGGFGQGIIGHYTDMITDGLGPLLELDLGSSANRLWQVLFTMVIHIVTDTWKRFIHDYSEYQFILFSLLGLSLPDFVSRWDEIQSAKASCPCCFDLEFSSVLLSAFPSVLAERPVEVQKSVHHAVGLLLHDISTHCPVSTDSVEVKNGHVQHIASKRGNMSVKTPAAAKEDTFLKSFIQQFNLQKYGWICKHCLQK